MSDTNYTETEALLLALRAGDGRELRDWLAGNLTPGELRVLYYAARDLARAAERVAEAMPYAAAGEGGEPAGG